VAPSAPIDWRAINTSTASLGSTKPATPDTSLMLTVATRIPSGRSATREAFCPLARKIGEKKRLRQDRAERHGILSTGSSSASVMGVPAGWLVPDN
jgi:hypothetical protein